MELGTGLGTVGELSEPPLVMLRRNNFLIWKVLINSGWGKVRARGRSGMAAEIECRVCGLLR